MKKIMYIIPAFAFALTASAALASYPMPQMPSNDIKVVNDNHACISNNVGAISSTGLNRLNVFGGFGTTITGNAEAGNTIQTQANDNTTVISAPCTMCGMGDIKVINKNGVRVENNVGAIAGTGSNSLNAGGFFAGGLQVTGAATSGSLVTNLVNTTVTKISK